MKWAALEAVYATRADGTRDVFRMDVNVGVGAVVGVGGVERRTGVVEERYAAGIGAGTDSRAVYVSSYEHADAGDGQHRARAEAALRTAQTLQKGGGDEYARGMPNSASWFMSAGTEREFDRMPVGKGAEAEARWTGGGEGMWAEMGRGGEVESMGTGNRIQPLD
jgi:hypothetical protein